MRPSLSLLLLYTFAVALPVFGAQTESVFSGANPEPWNFMREEPRLNAEFNHCTMGWARVSQIMSSGDSARKTCPSPMPS